MGGFKWGLGWFFFLSLISIVVFNVGFAFGFV